MTLPNIHRALLRSIQVVPTIAGSMPPSPQEWPTSSILPQILILFTTQHHMTRRGTSPPTDTACHLVASISKIWSQIIHAIYAVMVLLIITETLPNTPSFPFPHRLVLLSSAMLLSRSPQLSHNLRAVPLSPFPVFPFLPNPYLSTNRVRVQLDSTP
jgi:hypothetical protein